MQEGAFEELDTLWPYGGFTVKATERKLGEGKLTLTGQSFLFEAKSGEIIGFDFPALRVIRMVDSSTVEDVYSIQAELRSASFKVVYTFSDGTERDELPSEEDPYRTSLFRVLSAGVVARLLADHSSARVEGLTRLSDEKFEARIKDLERNITLFPSKKEYEDDIWWDEELKKKSLEVSEDEPMIWDDPYRDKLYYTGTNPSMTVDNALQKIDILQEDWVSGKLSPPQRARCVAIDRMVDLKQYELGYLGSKDKSSDVWRDRANHLVQFENAIGVDILKYTS